MSNGEANKQLLREMHHGHNYSQVEGKREAAFPKSSTIRRRNAGATSQVSKHSQQQQQQMQDSSQADEIDPTLDALHPDNIKLEAYEVDLTAVRQVDGFEEIKYKDAIFLGTVIKGKRHGKGVMKYRNGRQYEGFWEHDLRDGKGFERYPNGNTYFGQFKYGKAHGKGVYTWKNGEVYDGEWNQGVK